MPNFKDLSGQRFSRLVAVSRAPNSKSNQTQWLCNCDCGNTAIVRSASLLNGHTKSCGCYSDEIRKINTDQTTHGKSHTRLYGVWSGMKARCYNPHSKIYKYYGGKGVKICDEWRSDFDSFYDWSMNNGYEEGLSIDRIDSSGDYEPSNCRWADDYTQMNNMSTNRYFVFNGNKMTLTQIERTLGFSSGVLRYRVIKMGYPLDYAIRFKAGELPKNRRR